MGVFAGMICKAALHSSVGFLVACAGTGTTELLGFHAAGISNEESFVVHDKLLLQFALGEFVVVLLVVGDKGLGDSLTHGEDLGGGTTTGDTDADVETLEVTGTEEENGLPNLHAEGCGLEKLNRLAVHVDESLSGGGSSDSGCVLLATE